MTLRLLSACLLLTLSLGISANPCALGGRPFPVEDGTGMGGTGLKTVEGDSSGAGGTGHRDGTGSGGTGSKTVGGDRSGTGGTGHRDGTGSGGTGQQARDGDGSGTGGTGVVGIITGFGSVCVNGLEIHYDAGTPVLSNGASVSAGQLAVGQMAVVEAVGQGANLVARQIHVQHALIGRVQAVEGGQVKVWGQWVNLPGSQDLKPGARIKVSGYRLSSSSVFATRIDAALPQEADLLSGEVESVENGTAVINGVSVRMPAGSDPVKPGKEIRAIGKAEGGVFRADRIELAGMPDFLDKIDRLVMQDSIRSGKAGKMRVGVVEFALGAKTQVKGGATKDLKPGQVVRVEAEKKNGRMVIERIDIHTENRGHTHREKEAGSTTGAYRNGSEKEGTVDEERHQSENDEYESSEGHDRDEAEKPQSRDQEMNERSEKYEREEKSEKTEKSEKPEQVEKPEKVEKLEKVERIEKPEKLEKPEKIEKPEKVEKPERPEKDD